MIHHITEGCLSEEWHKDNVNKWAWINQSWTSNGLFKELILWPVCLFRIHLIVSGILPRAQNCFPEGQHPADYLRGINVRACEVNRRVDEFISSQPRVTYLPHPEWVRRDLLSRDGLHLSQLGAQTLASEIVQAVAVVTPVLSVRIFQITAISPSTFLKERLLRHLWGSSLNYPASVVLFLSGSAQHSGFCSQSPIHQSCSVLWLHLQVPAWQPGWDTLPPSLWAWLWCACSPTVWVPFL